MVIILRTIDLKSDSADKPIEEVGLSDFSYYSDNTMVFIGRAETIIYQTADQIKVFKWRTSSPNLVSPADDLLTYIAPMSDRKREQYFKSLLGFYDEHKWLFENAGSHIPMDLYMGSFYRCKVNDYRLFSSFSFPWAFSLDALTELKEKLVWFTQVRSEAGDTNTALFQISETVHLAVTFNYVESFEGFYAFFQVICTEPKDAYAFLEANRKHIVIEKNDKPSDHPGLLFGPKR